MCVQACVRQVCAAAYCMSDCTFSICLHGRVCAHMDACMMERGEEEVEELGLKPTRSTSQRLGGPSPALMATHVNPTTPKNRSVEHNTRTDIYTHSERRTHAPVSTQRITVCQSRQLPCRPSATHVQHCHTHLPAAQTRPLDWNNRIKNGTERNSDRTPLSPPACLTCSLTSMPKKKKKLLLWRCSCQEMSKAHCVQQ